MTQSTDVMRGQQLAEGAITVVGAGAVIMMVELSSINDQHLRLILPSGLTRIYGNYMLMELKLQPELAPSPKAHQVTIVLYSQQQY